MKKDQLIKEIKTLKRLCRMMLPEYESVAGMYPPEVAKDHRLHCKEIRKYLKSVKETE